MGKKHELERSHHQATNLLWYEPCYNSKTNVHQHLSLAGALTLHFTRQPASARFLREGTTPGLSGLPLFATHATQPNKRDTPLISFCEKE